MKIFPVILLVIIFLVACTTDPAPTTNRSSTANPVLTLVPGKSPKFINHEQPNLQVDFSLFEHVSCNFQYGWYECDEQSPLYKIGCLHIAKEDLLGGLTPGYPMAKCGYFFPEESSDNVNLTAECFSSTVRIDGVSCGRLVIFKDGTYLIVKNLEEFRAIFAPVDSPEEALGFALAVNKYYAQYGLENQKDYVYYVQAIEDTHIETVMGGYILHLFYTQGLGCAHDTEAVDVKVTNDGYVEELNRYRIYRDSSMDSVCVD